MWEAFRGRRLRNARADLQISFSHNESFNVKDCDGTQVKSFAVVQMITVTAAGLF